MKPVVSLRDLEWTLAIPRAVLRDLASNAPRHYHPFLLRQGEKLRKIDNPDEELRHVQRRINRRILDSVEMPGHLHGGGRGRSPLTNVVDHCGQRCLIRLDIENFFPSVTTRHVFSVWREQLGFGRQVSSLLTKLTTYRFRLPQGAPTSVALANLVLGPVEAIVQAEAAKLDIVSMRFVDDLGLSGEDPRPVIQAVATQLRALSLKIHRRKLKGAHGIMGPQDSQRLTGYGTNRKAGPSVPRDQRDKVRSAIQPDALTSSRIRGARKGDGADSGPNQLHSEDKSRNSEEPSRVSLLAPTTGTNDGPVNLRGIRRAAGGHSLLCPPLSGTRSLRPSTERACQQDPLCLDPLHAGEGIAVEPRDERQSEAVSRTILSRRLSCWRDSPMRICGRNTGLWNWVTGPVPICARSVPKVASRIDMTRSILGRQPLRTGIGVLSETQCSTPVETLFTDSTGSRARRRERLKTAFLTL